MSPSRTVAVARNFESKTTSVPPSDTPTFDSIKLAVPMDTPKHRSIMIVTPSQWTYASESPTVAATQYSAQAVATATGSLSPQPSNPRASVQPEVITQPQETASEPHEAQPTSSTREATTATYDNLLPAEPRSVTPGRSDSETAVENRLGLSLMPRTGATPPPPGVYSWVSTAGSSGAGSSPFLPPLRPLTQSTPSSATGRQPEGGGQAGDLPVSVSLRSQLQPLPVRIGISECQRLPLPPPLPLPLLERVAVKAPCLLPVAECSRRGTKLGSLLIGGNGNGSGGGSHAGSQRPAVSAIKEQLAHSLCGSDSLDRICSQRHRDSANCHDDGNADADRLDLYSPQPLTAMNVGVHCGSGCGSCSAPELMTGHCHNFHLPEYHPRHHDCHCQVSPHGPPVAATASSLNAAIATGSWPCSDAHRPFKRGRVSFHLEMRRDEGFKIAASGAQRPAVVKRGNTSSAVAAARIAACASAAFTPAGAPPTEAAVPSTTSWCSSRTASMLRKAVPQAEDSYEGPLLQQLNTMLQWQYSGSGTTLSKLTTTPLIDTTSQDQCGDGSRRLAVTSTSLDVSSNLQGLHACDKLPVPSSPCIQKSTAPLDAPAANAVAQIFSPASRVIDDSASVYAKQMQKIKSAVGLESQCLTDTALKLSGTKRQRGMDKILMWNRSSTRGICGHQDYCTEPQVQRCSSDSHCHAQKGLLCLELPDLNV